MNARAHDVHITSAYITLGQLLKFANVVSSGVEAKFYLSTHQPLVNGVVDNRRGKKLYPGDEVQLEEGVFKIS